MKINTKRKTSWIELTIDYGMNCSSDYFIAWGKDSESENYYNETFKTKE